MNKSETKSIDALLDFCGAEPRNTHYVNTMHGCTPGLNLLQFLANVLVCCSKKAVIKTNKKYALAGNQTQIYRL